MHLFKFPCISFPNFHLSCSTRSLSRSFVLLTTSFSFSLRKLNIVSRESYVRYVLYIYAFTIILPEYILFFLYYLQETHHTRPSFVLFSPLLLVLKKKLQLSSKHLCHTK